jgi:3-oxoacyl-[acyl-carrier-protein] synthase II
VSRRVVVTGMGVLCSGGRGKAAFLATLRAARPCFSAVCDPRLGTAPRPLAGLVDDAALPPDEAQLPPLTDRWIRLALGSAAEALAQAGCDPARLGRRLGLILATCSGPMQTLEAHYARIAAGQPQLSADELLRKRYYHGAAVLAKRFGICGLTTTITTACSAGTSAVGLATDLIRSQLLDVVLVGGSDAFSLSTYAGFAALKTTAPGTCAPFSLPVGMSLGEGSAFLVLEADTHAQARGATLLGEILGCGSSNDAYHCSAPDPTGEGQALAMRRALHQAGIAPDALGYVNAHGTGTESNDRAEAKALGRVFGTPPPVSSTKSMTGHCLGAAGTVELVAALLCAHDGVYPPTASYSGARDGCALDCIPDASRPWPEAGLFMSNNFAFGGNNMSLVATARPAADGSRPPLRPGTAVAIIGYGCVSAAGLGAEAIAAASERSDPCAATVTLPGGASVTVARVPPLEPRQLDRRIDVRNLDRASLLATLATAAAMKSAQVRERPADLAGTGLILALSAGPSRAEEQHLTHLCSSGFVLNSVGNFPYIVPNSVAGNVMRSFGMKGPNTVCNSGPGGGLLALALAATSLRNGHADTLIAAATDELSDRILTDMAGAGQCADTLPGEGAAALVLRALSADAPPAATVLGVIRGLAFACAHPTLALAAVIADALQNAGIAAGEIALIAARQADAEIARVVLGGAPIPVVDVSPQIGCPESALPLLQIIRCLTRPASVADTLRTPYILALAVAPLGAACAVIIERRAQQGDGG